jgi:hypothetical protein
MFDQKKFIEAGGHATDYLAARNRIVKRARESFSTAGSGRQLEAYRWFQS